MSLTLFLILSNVNLSTLHLGIESTINSHEAKEWLFTFILCLILTLLMLPCTGKTRLCGGLS